MLQVVDLFNNVLATCSTIDGAIAQAEKECAKGKTRVTVLEKCKDSVRVRGYAFTNHINGKVVFAWPGKCRECKGKGVMEFDSPNASTFFGAPSKSSILCAACSGMGEGPSDNCYVR